MIEFFISVQRDSTIYPDDRLSGVQRNGNEFSIIENPYYDNNDYLGSESTRNMTNNVDLEKIDVVTVTENVYYEM